MAMVFLSIVAWAAPYCVPTSTNGTTGGDFINGFALGTISNLNTGSATGTTYNDYTSQSTQLSQGGSFSLSITSGTFATEAYAAFIDYNGDSTFTTNEKLGQVQATAAGQVLTINFTVPINASLISTRLRVRSTRIFGGNTNMDACTNYTRGETEDYTVQIIAGGANGPIAYFGAVQPNITAGNTVDFIDSSSFTPTSWQWTFAGGNPSTSNVQNPTGIAYNNVGCYAVTLTATNAGGSNTVTRTCYVIVNPANPYCNTLYSTGCSGTNNINSVTITGTTLNNSGTGCNSLSGTAYSIFSNTGNTTATLYRGQAYQLNVTSSSTTSSIAAWIDYNQNNTFDSLEYISVANPATQNLAASIIVNIPAGTPTGTVRMRIRTRVNTGGAGGSAITATQACQSFTSGETEDYELTIMDAPPVAPTANFTANNFTITAGQSVNFTDLSNGLPTSWLWNFTGAATATSTAQNPSGIVYNTPGCYDVTLTATNAQGSNSATQTCYITVLAPTYCATLHSINCSAADNISNVTITGTTLANSSACDALNGNGYSIWPATGSTTGSMFQTGTYTVKVTTTNTRFIAMWIDYNHNTVFDSTEYKLITTASTANVAATTNITIPANVLTGATGMRIRSRSTIQGGTIGANDACTLFNNGETEDYTINIQAPPTIPPVAAFTASNDTVAIGQSLDFFDASTNLPNGWSWSFAGAATTTSTAQNPTGITYNTLGCYPVQLIASNNYGSDTVLATCYVTVIIPPYCTILYTANCSAADNINSVVVANTTLNNTNTGCNGTTATPGYHLFPDSANTTATMHAGTTYPISITTASARSSAVWIDYNQNGTFETTEYTFVSAATTPNVATTVNLVIPSTALLGQTRMRVRTRSTNAGLPATDACTVGASGETEDYIITIDAAPLLSPVAAFTADSTTIYFGQNVDFSDNSSNQPTSWLWSFPGGNPSTSTAQNPQNIVYSTNGCYPVTLIASNQYGADTITSTCYITVTDPPYCSNIQTNTCTGFGGAAYINTVSITGTNFNNANTGCTGTPYTIYPVSNNTSAILNRGDSYNFNITTTASQKVAVWIDYNHNFVFEASEYSLVANATLANFPAGISITIPQSAAVGTTGMRVRCRTTNSSLTANDACTTSNSGETEDYTITIGAGGNNPPVADFTADYLSISPFGSVNFSDLSANTPTSWTWSFPGASPSSSTVQNPTGIIYGTPGCYEVTLIASNAFGSDTMTMPCYINVTSAATFCIPAHSAACTNSYIKTVQITGTTLNNNNTSCDNITSQGYTIWPATGNKTGQLNRNQSYSLKVTCNVGSRISVWIDYNHNNIFETTEWTQVATGSQANIASTVTIFVPATAVAGPTGMRIRSITTPAGGPGVNASNGATNSCSTFATGESEDYTITIFDPTLIPVANFTANTTTVCVGESVTFTDASTNNPSVWNWTVPGTATGTASGQSPTVTYTTPGVYPVTLNVINGNGSDTVTLNNYITVNAGPTLNAGSNIAICSGSSTQLSATGSSNYSWSPSAGLSATNVANPTANPTQTTTYVVTSTASGCAAHDTVVVTVNPIPTHVLNNLPAITQCDGTVTLDAGNAGATYLWNDANASTTQTITVSSSQNYQVVTTNSFGCSITDSRNVTIHATPVVNLGAPVTQCGGTVTLNAGNTGATYLWSNNASTQSTTVSASGTYSVVVNNNGCTAAGSTVVTINSASVSVGQDVTICAGSTTSLTATGTGTFSWSPAAGLSDPNIANPIAAPATTTAYTVTITNNGCTATATQTVTVNPVGTNASAGSDVSICRTASTQLQATGGTSYAWTPSVGLSATNIANPTANPAATTTYSVVVTNAGCSATKVVTLTVVGENATAGLDLTVCPGNTANLSANGGTTYSWSPAANLSATNIANPVFTAGNTSTYFVTIGNGTCSYVDTVNINVGAVTANAGSDVTICNGTSANLLASGGASYSWSPSSGLSAGNVANPVANPSVTTSYIVTSSSGTCSATDTVVVNVIPSVTANAGNDVAICLGSSATLTATGGNSYTWSPSSGLNNANIASPIANPGTTTTYAVTVSNGSCSATDSITVSVQTLSVAVNSDTAFCAGGVAQLMAMSSNPIATYVWTPATGLNNASIMDPIATPQTTTTYTVVANDGVCSATNSVMITISSPVAPIISTAGPLSVCGNTPIVLNALASGVIVWTDANGAVLSNNNSYTATANGCYTATVVDANLCSASSVPACVNFNAIPATPVITLATDGSLNGSTVATSYSWTLDGNSISANTQSITPTANGLYTVAAVSDSGCVSAASAPFNYLVTNITASGYQEFVSVYPNPANSFVMVQAQFENSQVMTVTLKDITGRTIEVFTNGSASKTISKEFDLSKQAAGVYFIQFNGNGKSITKKIVKE